MIPRISHIETLPDFMLYVTFGDGKRVIYDIKADIRELPGYGLLVEVDGLFQQVQLDQSCTCVFWTEDIDLPSDTIYEYGELI